ncbi:putative leader peptide [Geodermatophilus sp. SYSU D00708]
MAVSRPGLTRRVAVDLLRVASARCRRR